MSLVGRHIGRYRILEQLGQGGMSIVYKGLDTALDREVAVKVLHPHLATKDESRKRLAREAKAVAKLHHPNILEVFDFAAVDSQDAYIVTEYIRGQTLRQFISAHSFEPPEIAAMVIHEIASALAHAHEAGIIHRDLKPENVMVREDGVLKLMDFGIAKIIDRDDKMTMTGALVGSPAHMAPEIIEGEEVGAEADVFSLGTMLYFFATTRLPFVGPNTTSTLKKILDGVYDDPRQLVPSLSDDLAEIIATCLARQSAARYPNAGKLRDALAEYLTSVGLPRVNEELCSFFNDPGSYRKELTGRLTAALVSRGEKMLAEKRPAKALSNLNQVLALDPTHARALALLQEMNVARKRQQAKGQWLRLALSTATLGALAFCGLRTYRYVTAVDDYVPGAERLDAVVIRAELFPPAPKPPVPQQPPLPVELPREVKPDIRPVAKVEPGPTTHVATFNLRPFGWVKVDGGKRTAEEKGQHLLQLAAGKHQIVYGCNYCLDRQTEITVQEGEENRYSLSVQPRPAQLRFEIQPPTSSFTAKLELGEGKFDSRSAADLRQRPFTVEFEPGAPKRVLNYEISAAGFKTARESVEVDPLRQFVTVQLEPE